MTNFENLVIEDRNANGEITCFSGMKREMIGGTLKVVKTDEGTMEIVKYFQGLPRVHVNSHGNPRPKVVYQGKEIALANVFYNAEEAQQYKDYKKGCNAGTGSKRIPKQDWDSWKKDHDELVELLEAMKSSKMPEKFIKKQESLVSAHKELEPKNPLRESLAQLGYSDAEISAIMSKAIKTA